MSMVDPTLTADTFTGTNVTIKRTKPGTLTEKDTTIQNNQLAVESNSRSDLEWLATNLSSGENTLVLSNLDLESDGTTHTMLTNGSCSTQELKLLEHSPGELTALVTNLDKDSRSTLLLLSDHTLDSTRTRSDGTVEKDKTSKTTAESALMSTEEATLTRDTLSSTTAIRVSTRPGGLIKTKLSGHNNH
jgi:hypothetical protein